MGQPAAKQGDKIVATDGHILMVPAAAGAPVPTPTPMPFTAEGQKEKKEELPASSEQEHLEEREQA